MTTLGDIAAKLGISLDAGADIEITALAGLAEAGSGQISFLAKDSYGALMADTSASAVITASEWEGECPAPILRVSDVNRAVMVVTAMLAPPAPVYDPGIHSSAVVSESARIDPSAHIGPLCVIEADVRIGVDTVILAGCVVGRGTVIGSGCLFHSNVSIRERTVIGNGVILHNGAVIGSDGYGYLTEKDGDAIRITKIPHAGNVELGDNVEIGANSTVDRARFGTTRIGRNVKIDNLVQVAHNVVIGDNSGLAAQAAVAGSVVIGSGVMLWGQAGIAGHLEIGDGAIVGGQAGVTKDVPPGAFVSGYPAMPHMEAAKSHANIMRIPKLKKKIADLEKRVAELEAGKEATE